MHICHLISSILVLFEILPQKTQLCTNQLQKFNGRRHDLVNRYGLYLSQMTTDMCQLS